jgi:hypothetical protein
MITSTKDARSTLDKILNTENPVLQEDRNILLDNLANAAEKIGNEIEDSRH